MNSKVYFTHQLLEWHRHTNRRSLPWKEEKDPYKIWLSEVILQQTRAEQGLQYYLNFTGTYPSVKELAAAEDAAVFRLWQGLGYYNRCRNMLATARYIAAELNGEFPDEYEDILALKGVGAYTAAAISSFAFDLPYAVVDGNVYRVLSRYFGIEQAIDTPTGKKLFSGLAQELIDTKHSAAWNQAIMDFGATICTPKQPRCAECPLSKKCIAVQQDLVTLLPVKLKKVAVTKRYFNFIVPEHEGAVWIQQRTEKGIWQSLHQFYLIESDAPIGFSALKKLDALQVLKQVKAEPELPASYTQRLTHQLIESRVYRVGLSSRPGSLPADGFWVPITELGRYAFPKTLVRFLHDSGLA